MRRLLLSAGLLPRLLLRPGVFPGGGGGAPPAPPAAAGGGRAAAIPATAAAPRGAERRCASPEGRTPRGENFPRAETLLEGLAALAALPPPAVPRVEMEEIADLAARRPETGEVFVDALARLDPRARFFLVLALRRVGDPGLGRRLRAALDRADPWRVELRRILADRARCLGILEGRTAPDLLPRVLGGLRRSQLRDPETARAVARLALSHPDGRVRSRAAARLRDVPPELAGVVLLRILADPSRGLAERQAAAGALADHPPPGAVRVFVSILLGDEAVPLQRFAARGLQGAEEEPGAVEALIGLAQRSDADPVARENAIVSLLALAGRSPGARGAAITARLRGVLRDLAPPEMRYRAALALAARGGPSGRVEVRRLYRETLSAEVRRRLRSDPVMRRILEGP